MTAVRFIRNGYWRRGSKIHVADISKPKSVTYGACQSAGGSCAARSSTSCSLLVLAERIHIERQLNADGFEDANVFPSETANRTSS